MSPQIVEGKGYIWRLASRGSAKLKREGRLPDGMLTEKKYYRLGYLGRCASFEAFRWLALEAI